ncbi:MAG: hypothetical protein ACREQ5_00895 [Candidatus Dormibacteria bacterium]
MDAMVDVGTPPHVFPGGECGATTWRQDVAIPRLLAEGVSFYNPQIGVGEWHSGLIQIEAVAKGRATQMLIPIGSTTLGTVSLMEAIKYSYTGTLLHLVVEDIADGTVVQGQVITGEVWKAAQRGRAYLLDLVPQRPNVFRHGSVEEALTVIVGIALACGAVTA